MFELPGTAMVACMVASPSCRVPGNGGDALSRTSIRRRAHGQARRLGGARRVGADHGDGLSLRNTAARRRQDARGALKRLTDRKTAAMVR